MQIDERIERFHPVLLSYSSSSRTQYELSETRARVQWKLLNGLKAKSIITGVIRRFNQGRPRTLERLHLRLT